MSEIKTTSLRTLWSKKAFTTISTLRFNQNKYPYVTFLNGKAAHNVYFGKKTAEIISGTFNEGEDLIKNSFLLDAQVVETKNEAGETRFKLSKSQGDYSSVASLEEAFGNPADTEFDFKSFSEQFSSPVTVQETA